VQGQLPQCAWLARDRRRRAPPAPCLQGTTAPPPSLPRTAAGLPPCTWPGGEAGSNAAAHLSSEPAEDHHCGAPAARALRWRPPERAGAAAGEEPRWHPRRGRGGCRGRATAATRGGQALGK